MSFQNVRFGYDIGHTDVRVLEGLTLEIQPGESVAIVGATGSGKSTIARLLLRFYDPQTGGIALDGVDLRELRLSELRRSVGVVFEDTLLFHDTVSSNIAFAKPGIDSDVVVRAAKLAGAHEFIMQLPEKYDTVLGERGFSLSGGQRQRIAIARALILRPQILVLDEPTSALDVSIQKQVLALLSELQKKYNLAYLMISHDLAVIRAMSHEVMVLKEGRVVEFGDTETLIKHPKQIYTKELFAAAELT